MPDDVMQIVYHPVVLSTRVSFSKLQVHVRYTPSYPYATLGYSLPIPRRFCGHVRKRPMVLCSMPSGFLAWTLTGVIHHRSRRTCNR